MALWRPKILPNDNTNMFKDVGVGMPQNNVHAPNKKDLFFFYLVKKISPSLDNVICLSYISLIYINLTYGSLTYTSLTCVSLTYTNLTYTSLIYANLTCASLTYTSLTYISNLRKSNLLKICWRLHGGYVAYIAVRQV